MTKNHALLLRTWAEAEKDKRVGAAGFLMKKFYEQSDLMQTWTVKLADDLQLWGLAEVGQAWGFGGPYGTVTARGRKWLEDNPSLGGRASGSG